MTHDQMTALQPRIGVRTIATALLSGSAPAARLPTRRRARTAVLVFALAVVGLHALAVFILDVAWTRFRDPEYGRRATSLRERVAEYPDRPLVLVVGSSRVSMGVRPDVWEERRPGTPHDPMLFNMSLVGSGPVMQLLTLRRSLADGFRPTVVLLEYWPPLLCDGGAQNEHDRIDVRRLRWDDRAVVRGYFPDPSETERQMLAARRNIFQSHRTLLMLQLTPDLLHRTAQQSGRGIEPDGWGWLAGMEPRDDEERQRLTDHVRPTVRGWMNGRTIHPTADRALRESVALAREHGAAVGFVYMPESTGSQRWYSPELEATARVHLRGLSDELSVPVIDARDWVADHDLADGMHLSRTGAGVFSARLGPAVVATFPTIGGKP